MNYITLTYQVSTDLVDEPANEQLFTLTLLEKLKKVYDKILEQLTPYDIRLLRDEGTNKKNKLITVHVKCSISVRGTDFNVNDLINKALRGA